VFFVFFSMGTCYLKQINMLCYVMLLTDVSLFYILISVSIYAVIVVRMQRNLNGPGPGSAREAHHIELDG